MLITPEGHGMSNVSGSEGEGILVAIRVRPLNEREVSNGQRCIWRCLPTYFSITQTTPDGNPLPDAKGSTFFTYDRIFAEAATNKEVRYPSLVSLTFS